MVSALNIPYNWICSLFWMNKEAILCLSSKSTSYTLDLVLMVWASSSIRYAGGVQLTVYMLFYFAPPPHTQF